MKLFTIPAIATTLLGSVTAANVQMINVSSMTCQEFTHSDPDRMNLIAMWFMGFYAEVQNPQVIDMTKFENLQSKFLAFCEEQPSFHLTTAAEGLLGK
jgi:HdeA/HdeB family